MNWWEAMRLHALHESEPPEGDDPPEGGGGGEEGDDNPAPRAIPVDVLPEELRGMSDQEVKFFLNRTLSGVKSANEENQALKERLAMIENKINAPPPADPDPDDEKELSELILENPEKAIERVARSRGWITSLESMGEKTDEALFATVASKIDDFDQYEDDVRKILKDSRAPVTKDSINFAYEMAVGRKTLREKQLARRKSLNPEKTRNDPPKPDNKLPPETALEKEIREAHNMTREQWNQHKSEDFNIKVPT